MEELWGEGGGGVVEGWWNGGGKMENPQWCSGSVGEWRVVSGVWVEEIRQG